MTAYTIFVYHLKGGVGKSTLVVNLAGALSMCKEKYRVLIVDMDPQCASTWMMGRTPKDLERSVCGVMLGISSCSKLIERTKIPQVDILPGSTDMWVADFNIEREKDRDKLLQNALQEVKGLYDFILVDAHNKYGWTEINALRASNGVIIPIQCSYLPLMNLLALHKILERFEHSYNQKVNILGYVLTMYHKKVIHHSQVSIETEKILREKFGNKVFNTVIEYSEDVELAAKVHEPVEYYSRWLRVSKEYMALAKEVIERARNSL
jgi:chromosome partitioning protein